MIGPDGEPREPKKARYASPPTHPPTYPPVRLYDCLLHPLYSSSFKPPSPPTHPPPHPPNSNAVTLYLVDNKEAVKKQLGEHATNDNIKSRIKELWRAEVKKENPLPTHPPLIHSSIHPFIHSSTSLAIHSHSFNHPPTHLPTYPHRPTTSRPSTAPVPRRRKLATIGYVSLLPTHPPTYSPTHLFTHSPTHPPTHSPTHALQEWNLYQSLLAKKKGKTSPPLAPPPPPPPPTDAPPAPMEVDGGEQKQEAVAAVASSPVEGGGGGGGEEYHIPRKGEVPVQQVEVDAGGKEEAAVAPAQEEGGEGVGGVLMET